MPARHILVFVVDGLRASALGAYGNTAFNTPSLDELAAECFLFDSCFAPAAGLPAIYRALWRSVHPLRSDAFAEGVATLPNLLADRDYHATLVTDSSDVAMLGTAAGFGECVQVSGEIHARANDVAQTALARLVAEACNVITDHGKSLRFVWVHSRGMYGPWDAPLELQEALAEEGDPPPIESIAPPELTIATGDDPDTAFRYGAAYAAQVMVLDACWEVLRAATSGDWQVNLLGLRGFPLGEHRRIGGVDGPLYAEQLHVPWLMHSPKGAGALARSGQLVSPLDLLPTIVDLLDGNGGAKVTFHGDGRSVLPLLQSARAPWRDMLLSGSDASDERAIRTADWSLQFDDRAAGGRLFVRPDDRWEANDVADLCPDVVDGLIEMTEKTAARIRSGEPMPNES